MTDNRFNDIPDEMLKTMVHNQPSGGYLSAQHKEAIAELERRNKIKDDDNKTRISTSIRWGMIASIASIIAAVFAIAQFFLSIYQSRRPHESEISRIQRQVQDSPQPSKKQEKLSSSSSNSSVTTKSMKLK